MIVHLTNKKAYEEVLRARENGQTVYAETCPQYLLLDDSAYNKPDFGGAVYVCALLSAKKKIRTVCGRLKREKSRQLPQTSAALLWNRKDWVKMISQKSPEVFPEFRQEERCFIHMELVRKITVEEMCRLLSENPAKLYGVYPRKGVIREGSDADIW